METKPKSIVPSFKDSENKFSIYTNHTGIGMTAFDVRLIFGQIEPTDQAQAAGPIQQMTVVQQGSVIMSPLHAKLFCASLQTSIENYEKTFGEINIPSAIRLHMPTE